MYLEICLRFWPVAFYVQEGVEDFLQTTIMGDNDLEAKDTQMIPGRNKIRNEYDK